MKEKDAKKNDDSHLPDLVLAHNLPEEPHSIDELLKSIEFEKKRPKSRGIKREMTDVDVLFPGPKSYRKPKKVKKDLPTPSPEISDMSCDTLPPSKAQ